MEQTTLLKIKVLKVDATEEPFLVPERTIQSKNISLLPFYNLKNLLSPQRSFCENRKVLQMLKLLMEPEKKVLLSHREAPLFLRVNALKFVNKA